LPLALDPIENGDSGLSVRLKLNQLFNAALNGGLPGTISPEDLDAAFDKVAPDPVTNLTLTSTLDPVPTLIATWDFCAALDFAYYDLQIAEGTSGPWISRTGTAERYSRSVQVATLYRARIRAFDKSGNASEFSDTVSITIAGDTIPPATPIDINVTGGLGNVWLKWMPNTEGDFAFYEIYESGSTTTPDSSAAATYATASATYVRSGISGKQTLNYWLRAVDTSGNRSPWSARKQVTTEATVQSDIVALDGILFTPAQGTGNRLQWTAGTISYGPPGESPTSKSVASGQVDWVSGTLYVYYVRGDTAISTTTDLVALYTANGLILGIYKGGADFQLVEGKAKINGADVLAQTIGANALVANEAVITGTAQLADAIISSAKIISLDAVKITAENIASNNALIGLINGANVGITPGQIVISGNTKLSDWRFGGDSTKINGGALGANSVATNSLTVGNRNLTFDGIQFTPNSTTADMLSWTAGTITYVGDDGTSKTVSIAAGTRGPFSAKYYLTWAKDAGIIDITTDVAVAYAADKVVIGTYSGGDTLSVTWGRTTIEGGNIKGIMAAFQSGDFDTLRTGILVADSITAPMMNVVNLAAISADLGDITGGSLNINNRFIVAADGTVTIQNAATGERLIITNSMFQVFDANGIERVKCGVWS